MPPDDVQNVVIEEQNFQDVEQQDEDLFNKDEVIKDKPIERVKEEPKPEEDETEETDEERETREAKEQEELDKLENESTTSDTAIFKNIAKEFPGFFKKFPELREIVGRELAYNELFPEGLEQARAVQEATKDFNFFSEKVTSGDAKSFLEVIKDAGKADLGEFVSNFLPALKDVDNSLYGEVTAPILVDALTAMYNDGSRLNNENLQNVALHAAHYLFNNAKFATGEIKLKPREKVDTKKVDDETKERNNFLMERYTVAHNDVDAAVTSKLEDYIKGELEEIEGLSDFAIEMLPEKIIREANSLLASDRMHMKKMEELWNKSQSSKFDFQSQQRIILAVMNRFKEVIPEIRRKLVAKALGKQVRTTEKRREVVSTSRGGRVSTHSNRQVDYSKTSDEDLFSGKKTYRS